MRQLITAIESISGRTKFSGNSLLTTQTGGSAATLFSLQVTDTTTDTISLSDQAFLDIGVGDTNPTIASTVTNAGGQAYDLINKINATNVTSGSATAAQAATAMQNIQSAATTYITALSTQRSLLGAYQNQIEFTVSNVTDLSSNLSAARSNVQDTDYASETAALTKGQILQQAATAMLAQANQMPNVILSLLK